jgi:hypothetical protein
MRRTVIIALALLAAPTMAADASPYAGEETRAIKSLSADDIAELRRGGGWGLAKAAELNGMPGPAHLLDKADRLGLTPQQVADIEAIRDAMRAAAIETGTRLIDQEARLENRFQDRSIAEDTLRVAVSEIAASRGELRFIHLRAHLETLPLLSDHQVVMYNRLRGYGSDGDHGSHGGHSGHGMSHGQ